MTKKSICICGGGSLGHVIAAVLSNKGCNVDLLTGHPDKWHKDIIITDYLGKEIKGTIRTISNMPEKVVTQADIILLCLPGYLIEKILREIKPYISSDAYVGSVVCSNGFFWIAKDILGPHKLFGFQRVPYICRISEYGKNATIKGYKSQLKIAGNNQTNLSELSSFFSESFETPVAILKHYLEATLTNSNPLLHPTRIFGMLKNHKTDIFDKEFLFYDEWDDSSSEILIRCDGEFQDLLAGMPIDRGEIPNILDYYDSINASSLTHKLSTIKAFKGIKMSMVTINGSYSIDYTNRYFTEDIPFGLLIIKSIAVLLHKETPNIDSVINWMQKKMNKKYLINGKFEGEDLSTSGIVQNYHINTAEKLFTL